MPASPSRARDLALVHDAVRRTATGPPRAARARRRTAAGTAARAAGSRRGATGLPSSVKPSAPVSRSSAISVSASPARPVVIEARKPTGTRASRRAASRSERSTGAESTTGSVFGIAITRDEAAGRGRAGAGVEVLLVLLPGRAQVHVRVDEAGEQVAALAVEHLGAVRAPRASRARRARRSRRRARARRAGASMPARGSSTWAPRISRSAGALSRTTSGACDWPPLDSREGHHASCGAGVDGAVRGRGAARQQLVEDRHADDDAGRDLLADHRLRRVDHLGAKLDAAVDRAGVHEHLAGAQAAAVDLVDGGVLAQRGHVGVGHALALHPQRVDDVGLGEPVEPVLDLAAERLDPARDQRRRAADGDLGAELA